MKSIYIQDNIHNQLKLFATFDGKTLTQLIEEFLSRAVKRRIADLPAEQLSRLSAVGGSFDFLKQPGEDIYSDTDGTPVS